MEHSVLSGMSPSNPSPQGVRSKQKEFEREDGGPKKTVCSRYNRTDTYMNLQKLAAYTGPDAVVPCWDSVCQGLASLEFIHFRVRGVWIRNIARRKRDTETPLANSLEGARIGLNSLSSSQGRTDPLLWAPTAYTCPHQTGYEY